MKENEGSTSLNSKHVSIHHLQQVGSSKGQYTQPRAAMAESVSSAEARASEPEGSNARSASKCTSDVRILRDTNRFNEMRPDWKYEGRYRFADLKQANDEIHYLCKKVTEFKVACELHDTDVSEMSNKYNMAESTRNKILRQIDELNEEIEKCGADKKKYETRGREAEALYAHASEKVLEYEERLDNAREGRDEVGIAKST